MRIQNSITDCASLIELPLKVKLIIFGRKKRRLVRRKMLMAISLVFMDRNGFFVFNSLSHLNEFRR